MELEPITRQEQIIAGKDLEPITRMERFLKEYGGGAGGAVSDEQIKNAVESYLDENPIGVDLSVAGATVGQTVKISEVDANGKPTKWTAVDLPSGGGAMEFIGTLSIESGVSEASFELGGEYSRVMIVDTSPGTAAVTSGGFTVYLNASYKNAHKIIHVSNAASAWQYFKAVFETVYGEGLSKPWWTYANHYQAGQGVAGNVQGTGTAHDVHISNYPNKVIFIATTTDATFNAKTYAFWGVKV